MALVFDHTFFGDLNMLCRKIRAKKPLLWHQHFPILLKTKNNVGIHKYMYFLLKKNKIVLLNWKYPLKKLIALISMDRLSPIFVIHRHSVCCHSNRCVYCPNAFQPESTEVTVGLMIIDFLRALLVVQLGKRNSKLLIISRWD